MSEYEYPDLGFQHASRSSAQILSTQTPSKMPLFNCVQVPDAEAQAIHIADIQPIWFSSYSAMSQSRVNWKHPAEHMLETLSDYQKLIASAESHSSQPTYTKEPQNASRSLQVSACLAAEEMWLRTFT
jgi:hypothetical protein